MKKTRFTKTIGFTLIEMLVVVSIIGILAGIILVSQGPVQSQARDTRRKNDLKQYQSALEVYASKNGSFFPASGTTGVSVAAESTLCGYLGMSNCPADPNRTQPNGYRYKTESGTAGQPVATRFFLWAQLENFPSTTYWVICSDGKSGILPGTSYPGTLSGSSPTCPL